MSDTLRVSAPAVRSEADESMLSRRSSLPRGRRAFLEKARRAVGRLRAKVLFIGCRGGEALCATGHVRVRLRGGATLGSRVTFLGGMIPSSVSVEQGAVLKIGDETILNYGVSIVARSSITIGRRCMFGSFVRLSDESMGRVAPVVLGDDVWVAHGAIIQPGVTIGNGSVVSAGSVVTADVPPRSVAIGNPARVMSLDLTVEG
jgi:carbonic anhydrase/acetyltransferase-like protein (isoleucine patch superfamily)